MKQVMNCHKDNGLLNMIRTDPMITQRKNDNAKFFRRQIALCHCFYEKD